MDKLIAVLNLEQFSVLTDIFNTNVAVFPEEFHVWTFVTESTFDFERLRHLQLKVIPHSEVKNANPRSLIYFNPRINRPKKKFFSIPFSLLYSSTIFVYPINNLIINDIECDTVKIVPIEEKIVDGDVTYGSNINLTYLIQCQILLDKLFVQDTFITLDLYQVLNNFIINLQYDRQLVVIFKSKQYMKMTNECILDDLGMILM